MPLRTALILLMLVAPTVVPSPASAGVAQAAAYLQRGTVDGCRLEAGRVSVGFTAWGVIGLEAAGRSGAAGVRCLERHGGDLRAVNDIELAILAAVAAGRNPRAFAGRNLVAELRRRTRRGTTGLPALDLFAVLALRGAREPVPGPLLTRVLRSQRRDGAWGLGAGLPGEADLTAAGIQALRAVGQGPRTPRVRRALTALARFRNADGGFGLHRADPSNSQSTAWAMQALAACGRPTVGARRHLLRLQVADGSIRYSRSAAPTPFWVTAQALAALAGRPLPIRG